MFSEAVFKILKQSAKEYAFIEANLKSQDSLSTQYQQVIGYKCKDNDFEQVDKIKHLITLLEKHLLSERKKASLNLASYSFHQHKRLHKLLNETKEKHDKLLAYRA